MSENQNSSSEQGVEKYLFRASAADFKKIPGSPVAYFATPGVLSAFCDFPALSEIGNPRLPMTTGDNGRFMRQWFEVGINRIGFGCQSRQESKSSGMRWFPCNKGGAFRRWYGNNSFVVDWENDGERIIELNTHLYGSPSRNIRSMDCYFLESVTWSSVSSATFSARYSPKGFLFATGGSCAFPGSQDVLTVLATLLSRVSIHILGVLSPTLNFEVGTIGALPYATHKDRCLVIRTTTSAIEISRTDWDAYESSWDFSGLALLHPDHHQPTLKANYQKLRVHWREKTLEMQRLEEENNRIFINAYGLQDELNPEVPLNEITLTCNPRYRYGGDKSEDELEAMLLADTMRELVSYAVGCMFGRYSLDKPGLILANQGETLEDYLAQVPQPSFPADGDNVIPLLDGDWFADDITLRFRQFLRVAFGEAHYEDNLAFIEQALNIKGKRNYGLRDYFLGEFYTDHVKRYKKRPIYWLFSSPKGSFSALIYMHRYRPDTVSVVLKYLRDYRQKLIDEKDRQDAVSINPASSQGDKTRAQKEVDRLAKALAELEDYERDVLYPLATEQKHIDLDDGVKKNYAEFGQALKKIPGLDAKEEE